jgi:hypothetical protein
VKYQGEEEHIVIPETVMKIGNASFSNNTILKSVVFGNTIIEIADGGLF